MLRYCASMVWVAPLYRLFLSTLLIVLVSLPSDFSKVTEPTPNPDQSLLLTSNAMSLPVWCARPIQFVRLEKKFPVKFGSELKRYAQGGKRHPAYRSFRALAVSLGVISFVYFYRASTLTLHGDSFAFNVLVSLSLAIGLASLMRSAWPTSTFYLRSIARQRWSESVNVENTWLKVLRMAIVSVGMAYWVWENSGFELLSSLAIALDSSIQWKFFYFLGSFMTISWGIHQFIARYRPHFYDRLKYPKVRGFEFIMSVLVDPLIEEVLFRWFLFDYLNYFFMRFPPFHESFGQWVAWGAIKDWPLGTVLAMLISAGCFYRLHEHKRWIHHYVFGLLFCAIYKERGSLGALVILHSLSNAMLIAFSEFRQRGRMSSVHRSPAVLQSPA